MFSIAQNVIISGYVEDTNSTEKEMDIQTYGGKSGKSSSAGRRARGSRAECPGSG